MKIICSKSSLLKSVSIALKAVPSKNHNADPGMYSYGCNPNQTNFTTNDMELGIETIVEGTIEEKVKLLLCKIFYEIIRRLPDNDITIKLMINMQQPSPVKKQNSISPENQEKILLIYR